MLWRSPDWAEDGSRRRSFALLLLVWHTVPLHLDFHHLRVGLSGHSPAMLTGPMCSAVDDALQYSLFLLVRQDIRHRFGHQLQPTACL